MKKFLAMLTVLALLCTAAAGVLAETGQMPDLYDLYTTAKGETSWVGTAVPIMDGVVLASPAELPQSVNGMEVWDGKAYRPVLLRLDTANGTVAVLLYETDGEEAGIPAYPFLETARTPLADELLVRHGDWMQSRINRAVYEVTPISWNEGDAMLLTLSGETTLGAPVETRDGKLAGIVVAQYAEGLNRYIAITVPAVGGCLEEAADLLENPPTDDRPEGYTVTLDGNLVTFDWAGAELPRPEEGEKLYHIVSDAESTYLTYMEVSEGETSVTMLLTPGRTYVSGLGVYSEIPSVLPPQMAVTTLPEAEPIRDFGLVSDVFAIAELAEDAPAGAMPVPAETVTEELLRSGRGCIYSVTHYQVESEKDDSTLLITLTAPDGSNYRYESGWYYDPTIMDRDEWYVTLDKAGILEMLNVNGYPEGTYTMDMYIDGQLADHFSFELVK